MENGNIRPALWKLYFVWASEWNFIQGYEEFLTALGQLIEDAEDVSLFKETRVIELR